MGRGRPRGKGSGFTPEYVGLECPCGREPTGSGGEAGRGIKEGGGQCKWIWVSADKEMLSKLKGCILCGWVYFR